MLASYSGVSVQLFSVVNQKSIDDAEKTNQYRRVYTSVQKVDLDTTINRFKNKDFWEDNPLILREKIVNGLYDVAKQFSDDYNEIVEEK